MGDYLVAGFLTTEPNGILPAREYQGHARDLDHTRDAWLSPEPAEAMKVQRPLPDAQLKIVVRGENRLSRSTLPYFCRTSLNWP